MTLRITIKNATEKTHFRINWRVVQVVQNLWINLANFIIKLDNKLQCTPKSQFTKILPMSKLN